ncbi:MAG: CpaD family pilus assembly protein [Stellaceae bacterium]
MTNLHTAIIGHRGRTARRLLAAAGLAALLGGCYQTHVAQQTPYPTDLRARHPITLREGVHSVEVFLGRNRGGLTPSQRADVLAFGQLWRREATSGIIIDVPHGGPTDHAAADSLREIYSIFAASGIPRRAIYVRSYHPSSTSLASIKINYSKLIAQAGPCGLWPSDLGPSMSKSYDENRPYWNLGCSMQHNLAAMIDDPADLVQPRGESPAFEARRSVAIDKWRKGENPSGAYPSDYDKSKISEIGK